jgi:hypothetical protein
VLAFKAKGSIFAMFVFLEKKCHVAEAGIFYFLKKKKLDV